MSLRSLIVSESCFRSASKSEVEALQLASALAPCANTSIGEAGGICVRTKTNISDNGKCDRRMRLTILELTYLSTHLHLAAERRDDVDDAHVDAAIPFHRCETLVVSIDPLRHQIIGQRPQRNADGLWALVENPELPKQKGGH